MKIFLNRNSKLAHILSNNCSSFKNGSIPCKPEQITESLHSDYAAYIKTWISNNIDDMTMLLTELQYKHDETAKNMSLLAYIQKNGFVNGPVLPTFEDFQQQSAC